MNGRTQARNKEGAVEYERFTVIGLFFGGSAMLPARQALMVLGWVILSAGIAGCSSLPPLEDAISRNDTQKAVNLIDKGEGLGELDALSRTPLHWAALTDNVEVAKLLISKGLSTEAKAKGGATPLYIAAFDCHVATARLLLDNGSAVDAADDLGSTPMIGACTLKSKKDTTQQLATVELLLMRGAKPNTRGNRGWTSLHCAAELADPAVVRTLLAHGAYAQSTAQCGYKPIHNAALLDRQANAFVLLDAGAIPEVTPTLPEAGARSYRLAAQYMEARSRWSIADAYYHDAIREFQTQLAVSRDLVKQYDEKGSQAFWGGLGEDILMGTLAGLSHTTVTYTRPNPNYWYSLKDQSQKRADVCQRLADECTARIAILERTHKL